MKERREREEEKREREESGESGDRILYLVAINVSNMIRPFELDGSFSATLGTTVRDPKHGPCARTRAFCS